MRSIDRALGRAPGTAAGSADFSTRPYGTTKADAAKIAAAAPTAPGAATVAGATGDAGGKSNMTTSSYGYTGASKGPIQ
jgi:hypothetical protein